MSLDLEFGPSDAVDNKAYIDALYADVVEGGTYQIPTATAARQTVDAAFGDVATTQSDHHESERASADTVRAISGEGARVYSLRTDWLAQQWRDNLTQARWQ